MMQGEGLPYSNELKQMGTIDVRFDKRTRESLVKQDAVD